MKQPVTMTILPQYSEDDVLLALLFSVAKDDDDDPLRCTRWDHVLDGYCPFRAA